MHIRWASQTQCFNHLSKQWQDRLPSQNPKRANSSGIHCNETTFSICFLYSLQHSLHCYWTLTRLGICGKSSIHMHIQRSRSSWGTSRRAAPHSSNCKGPRNFFATSIRNDISGRYPRHCRSCPQRWGMGMLVVAMGPILRIPYPVLKHCACGCRRGSCSGRIGTVFRSASSFGGARIVAVKLCWQGWWAVLPLPADLTHFAPAWDSLPSSNASFAQRGRKSSKIIQIAERSSYPSSSIISPIVIAVTK